MEAVARKIKELHSDDKEQLDVIFSNEKRTIVEAPAGYGKTKTMISKIAYLIASNWVPNPKKSLALTFSVNAAYKIKKDVAEHLPAILSIAPISPVNVRNKVFATNYHGFCRRVLRLYGYLLHPNLKRIDFLKGIDDDNTQELINLDIGLSYDDAKEISDCNDAVKQINIDYLKENAPFYLRKVKDFFLPNNYIPFNAILLLTLELLTKYPQILQFYRSYFPVIIVDEFQDTNILSWTLLRRLIAEDTRLILIGDPLQRIYGFIGAIPNLMSKAQGKYEMHKIELKTNYRFRDNRLLLQLDRNIRENAKNPWEPVIKNPANIRVFEAENQEEESQGIVNLVQKILSQDPNSKITVLVKQRGRNTDKILETFGDFDLPFFYALYSDEDEEYIKFHRKSLSIFLDTILSYHGRINRTICNRFLKNLKDIYKDHYSEIHASLLQLLKTFLERVFRKFNFLTIEEKVEFIKDTIENKTLKQYLGYVDSNIIISTVHGAKGLEWDYVILPDMEQYSFPNWNGLCGVCQSKNTCNINWSSIQAGTDFEKKFYEELSVFYVAATRAKKGIYFSYSQIGINWRGWNRSNNLSCLLKLQGINTSILPYSLAEGLPKKLLATVLKN